MRKGLSAAALVLGVWLAMTGGAVAAEIRVMISGGFTPAYTALGKQFEAVTGDRLVTIRGSSMGPPPNSIPARIDAGEPVDVVIMVGEGLQLLVERGKVIDRKDLAWSRIGMSVRAGATRPDISTLEALRRTLLAAKSIGYSASASGIYIRTELFEKLGVASEVGPKAREVGGAAAAVARGEVELGFQQMSELMPVAGADLVGPIPEAVQLISSYSAGISTTAREPDRARALVAFLSSPRALQDILKTGMYPPGP